MAKFSKNMLKDLHNLSDANGIPAYEDQIRTIVKDGLKDIKDVSFETDGLGSLAVIKPSTNKDAPTISFTAHMDEVGFLVMQIEKSGYLRFSSVGGWWGHVVLGQRLTITTRSGKEITGVVGSKPPHIVRAEERMKVLSIKDMFIDIGAKSDKEVKEWGINIGDMVTPTSKSFTTNNEEIFIGKALDDRASVAVGMEVMRRLSKEDHKANAIFVASVQEEVGLRGARTSAYKWTPDVAFAVDVTIANDMPGIPEKDTKVGSGVALSIFDRSIVANPKLVRKAEEVAKEYKIPYTFDGLADGGTDAGAIHLTKEGVITMTLSIPSRYFHSHNGLVSLEDMQATVELIVNFIKDFTNEDLAKLQF